MIESFKLALRELTSNKGRTILTALGIAIGVMAITLIISSGDIAKQYIASYLTKSVGKTTTFAVIPNAVGGGGSAKMTIEDIKYIERLKDSYPIIDVSPLYLQSAPIKNYLDENINQPIRGTDLAWPLVSANKNLSNIEGRFFSDNEMSTGANVIVVSKQFSKDILGKSSAINDYVTLKGQRFQIIGEYQGEASLFGTEVEVFAPISTLWKIDESNDPLVSQAIFTVREESQVSYVETNLANQVNDYRAKTFSGDQAKPLTFRTSKSAIETFAAILTGFQAFLSLVAVIALVVGGIGVLNVMLMAVSQRIKEIGIRKAFGAKNTDILILFLSESVLLTSLSGVFGAMLAQYLIYIGVRGANYINPDLGLAAEYSWSSIYISFLLSIVLGVLFGIYPAYKAGKMSVVDALRYE